MSTATDPPPRTAKKQKLQRDHRVQTPRSPLSHLYEKSLGREEKIFRREKQWEKEKEKGLEGGWG